MKASILALSLVVLIALSAAPRQASASFLYLNGAQLYAANSSGDHVNVNSYRHTTNASDTLASKMAVALGEAFPTVDPNSLGISLQLLTGQDTTFSFITQNFAPPTNYIGLNLFFSTVNQPYNPANQHVAGDLSVFNALNAVTFSPTLNKVQATMKVENYARSGSDENRPNANGNIVFTAGNLSVEVTSFRINHTMGSPLSGSFKLKVTATPEPATIGLGALGCVAGINLVRRRWKRKVH